ncbi:hypothetical protein GQ457_01G034500 [Hibiscus cannabinus]
MSLKQPKVSLQDPAYRYPSISTGTRVLTNISVLTGPSVPIPKSQYWYPRYRYPSIFLNLRIPVAKLSTDTQGEYRYPRGSTDTRRSSTGTLCIKCPTASLFCW